MASLIHGFEYDIFISYRQKDNKGDGWVSRFVEALKTELESTFKEDVSVYFDINPHDGLLETHDVHASLKEKLKCIVFIPVISRTYCDHKSFAWEHEFKAFVDLTSRDRFGLKINLPNGNIASRVLPVLIHDLETADIKECESVLGGVLRGIEFIYKEPGVNKPLTSDDENKKNLNNTKYIIQINKIANAIKEIISGLKGEAVKTASKPSEVLLVHNKPIILEKSILVLPFDNMSSDPDQEYFSDGLTEEIITDLSHINDLLVISRSSAMTFKGTKKTIPEIAKLVNVRFVLEGSVRKSGKSLRITAQLIDAMNDTHLWAEKYSGTMDDIFDIQEKVSQKIIEALKGHLSPIDRQKLFTDPATKNVGVYEVYSRAHYEFWKYEPGSQERALSLLEDAVLVFGEHPLLLSGIGAIHWQFYHQRGDIKQSHLERIKECAGKLFDIDPNSAPGNRLSSYTALHDGDSEKAIKHLYKSMRTEPGDTETLLWLSYLLIFHAGQPEMAQPIAERWIAIDPLHPLAEITLRIIEWMKGDFDIAILGLEKCYRQEPDNPIYSFYLGHLLTWRGRQEEAYNIAEKMHRLDPDEGMGQGLRFITSATTRRTEQADNAVTPSTKQWLWMDFHMPWLMAEGFSILGEKDEAIRWLERAVEKGFFNYPMLNEKDPLLDNIRRESGFKDLMNKIKYKWENFKV
jgi:TolB-like protein/tetratricopeptide (TPR) repeat protein